VLDDSTQCLDISLERALKTASEFAARGQKTATHMDCEKVLLRPLTRRATLARTRARAGRETIIKLEQEALFASLGAPLHPLALSHERDRLRLAWDVKQLGLLFDLNDFLLSVFGEKDSYRRKINE
jgi:hypothetical protein